MLIDSHCHLTNSKLAGDVEAVVAQAREADVVALLSASSSVGDARAAMDVASRHADVYFAAGVHPHEADAAAENYLAQLREIVAAGGPKCAAVGEMGLDYHYDFSPREAQQRVFRGQLDLARQLGKPVIVHTREATADTLALLAEFAGSVQGVIHSFTGAADEAERFLEQGWHISFSGIVTFKSSDSLRQACRLVPDERLLVETDSPYLAPEPVRKVHPNTPAQVVHVARCVAAARGQSLEQVQAFTTANARRLFNIAI